MRYSSCPIVTCSAKKRYENKKTNTYEINFFSLPSVFRQNGLKGGNLFLLQNDKKTISINSYENDRINELKTFQVSDKSISTTDQKERVVILDTAKGDVIIFDIHSSNQIKLSIPFEIKPNTILPNYDNLFIGGEMGKEILIQYHFQN